MRLKEARVVLTGASSGIGLDLLKLLLDQGAYVLAVSRSVESLDLTHENLIKKNIDLSNKASIDELFNDALSHFPSIDVFISNAGFSYYERLYQADMAHIETIFNVNTITQIYAAIKMKEHHQDKPFNFMATLSAASFVSLPGYSLYSGTKSALRGFFDGFRLEMQAGQVITTVFPVATKTNFFKRANQDHMPWPVQSSEYVAKTMLKALKKDKTHVYPSKLFKYSYRFIPWFYYFYKRRELKKFNKEK